MEDDCIVGPFKRGANPIWSLVDLDGNQFDDTFYLWVLENQIPYLPETVYHTSTGTPWTSPIQFLANGTLPIDIFFDPNKVYRLEFRQNVGPLPPSQADPLIYLVENYVSGGTGDGPGDVNSSPTNNQISNPQFSIVSFSDPFDSVPLTTGTIEIAPDWYLDLVGSGNVTLEQVPLNSATSNPTNAPYALRIVLNGAWTSAVLRQTFDQNGMLWAEKFVAVSYTARIEGAPQNVTARLDASDGAQLAVLSTDALSNEFIEYTGVAELPATTNADIPPDAWIDFKLILPTTADMYFTSVQLIAASQETQFMYEQDSIERQEDHLFHYYNPQLQYKPIPSHLVGWDFAMNPAQFAPITPGVWGPYANGSNTSTYVWDQTIVFQSSDSGFEVTRSSVGALRLTMDTNNVRCALIQYLEAQKAREILNDRISVNVACLKSVGVARTGIVQIYYTTDAALPDIKSPVFESIVDTMNADGSVNPDNGNWTAVPRGNLGPAYFDVQTVVDNNFIDTMLTGWDLEGSVDVTTATYIAIVVGFEEMDQNESVDIHSISLCSGDIATRPAPKTVNETLADCQRFYSKTFFPDVAPAQNAGANSGFIEWQVVNATGDSIYQYRYPVSMRDTPVIVTYNPAQANSSIWNFNQTTVAATTSVSNINVNAVTLDALTTVGWANGDILGVHLTADARFGVVL